MRQVVDLVAGHAAERWADGPVERADVAWAHRTGDLSAFSRGAGAGARPPVGRKPEWMRVPLETGPEYLRLKSTMRSKRLTTVCEEAGCPNVFDCWNDGTATFMINGGRCTRACGFCLVDTGRPDGLDLDEPRRVAEAVADMGLRHAVVTAVARDDLPDGGAAAFVATIAAIRERNPGTAVEVLIPDCKGDPDALRLVFDARPEVLNHNIETVARLQRRVRPSASYARSLSVLARAGAAGLTTKSSIIVGLGETDGEVDACLADLAAVGCDIVTIGQYLRPTTSHLEVDRWVEPATFDRWAVVGMALGIGHVEAGPLTRSSYHARQAAEAAGVAPVVDRPVQVALSARPA
jgi:lipoic acid synthetase